MGGELEFVYQLTQMTEVMHKVMVDGMQSFSRLSSTYNNLLAMGAVGVQNDHGGRYENRVGDHCVTICGRTYSFMP